jgi:hypothetical protein
MEKGLAEGWILIWRTRRSKSTVSEVAAIPFAISFIVMAAAVHGSQSAYIEVGNGCCMVTSTNGESDMAVPVAVAMGPEVTHFGWEHSYTFRELEEAIAVSAPKHIVGHDIVYSIFTGG